MIVTRNRHSIVYLYNTYVKTHNTFSNEIYVYRETEKGRFYVCGPRTPAHDLSLHLILSK